MRKKRRNTKRRKLWLGVLIILAAIGMVSYHNGLREREADEEAKKPAWIHLNDTLTNAMSDRAETEKMDEAVEKYLRRWEIKGAQLAIARHDTLVYAKGYGWADEERGERMTPAHILRVASVSKLLTAAGIMKLQEMGKLRLTDRVFGPQGVLRDTAYTNAIKDKRHFDITIEQLLRHQAGFTNAAGDPMFSTRYIMMQNRLSTPPDHRKLLDIVLRRRLGYTPGEGQRYSNLGYLLLSLIIEQASGQSYEAFMREHVFEPAGCFDFHIAGNYYEDRRPREVRYYMHKDATPVPEFNNSGREVPKCYGENDIPRLLGAGAWCGSAAELCRFVCSIDGDPRQPDILTEAGVREMTREAENHGFSLGWNFTPEGKPWTRTGTLSGTSALIVYYPDGECWVWLTNTSTWKGQGFAKDTMQFFERLRKEYSARLRPLPLYDKPTEPKA